MIAGLLFIPLLPMLMATSLGSLTRYAQLARQGLVALVLGLGLLVLTGAGVAAVAGGPVGYDQSSPLPVTVLIASRISTLSCGLKEGRRTSTVDGVRTLVIRPPFASRLPCSQSSRGWSVVKRRSCRHWPMPV